jgi:alpha-N-arabinofuranosidase
MNVPRIALALSLLGAVAAGGPALAAAPAAVVVELAKPGPALSPLLYGQFIEHFGRCIRDGVWAEKLRDRKFLLEPGKSWDVVRPEGADFDAYPEAAGAWAGDHCLGLQVRDAKGSRCGVRQGGLGVVAGREYVGYAVLAQPGNPAPVEVRLSWGPGPQDGQSVTLSEVGPSSRKLPFRFRAGATTDNASLSLTLASPGTLWAAGLSLMPAENVNGLRADVLALIKQLAPPIVRWPGGNFVSGYRWRDGIGDRDRRPPRWERAWEAVEDNDFGMDEFLAFCREIGTEPYIAVNTGLGSVADAADEVEYANGLASTPGGAERARNGHTEPYRVAWWGIGNEMYGDWQLGHVSVERYAQRHNAFVRAMRERDPKIRVIGVGTPGKWNDVMLPVSAGSMDLLSAHHYTERKRKLPFSPEDAKAYAGGFVDYSGDVARGIARLVTDLRQRQGRGDAALDRLRLAVDEWGIVREWNPAPDGPGVGAYEHYYCLGDAIAVARGLHEILRSADAVTMANWAQTVSAIGAIKASRTAAVLDPAGHVLALYRAHMGGVLAPVRVEGASTVDAVASVDPARGALSLGLVNFSPDRAATVRVRLAGAKAGASGKAWRIDGPSLGAINVPSQPEAVTTLALPAPVGLGRPLTLPAHSITVLEVPVSAR